MYICNNKFLFSLYKKTDVLYLKVYVVGLIGMSFREIQILISVLK